MNIIDRIRTKFNLENGTTQDVVSAVNTYYSVEGKSFAQLWNETRGFKDLFSITLDGTDDLITMDTAIVTGDYIRYKFDIKTTSDKDDESDGIFYGGSVAGASAKVYIKNGLISTKHGTNEVQSRVDISDDVWYTVDMSFDMRDRATSAAPDISIIVDGDGLLDGTPNGNVGWSEFGLSVIGGIPYSNFTIRNLNVYDEDGLVLRFRFDEGSGSVLTESSGNGHSAATLGLYGGGNTDLDTAWTIEKDSSVQEGK